MKKTLLTLVVAFATLLSANAQTWEWGTATWNIQDGRVYENLDDLNLEGIVLTYPNPANYTLTFFNMLAVSYDLYIDNATEPVQAFASARGTGAAPESVNVVFDYEWVEGHSYKIVTTGAAVAQANIATYTTDTLSLNSDSYTVSFSIKGKELVKTIDVEGTMALTITDQYNPLTYSLIDVNSITAALGIDDISQATIYGLNLNGSYNADFIGLYDGWRDADGEYTTYWGGWDAGHGHNAYPAVYCIKLNETADTVSYFFYDWWKEYDPEAPDTIPGTGSQAKLRAPETVYNDTLWAWNWVDSTGVEQLTYYDRKYRVTEGQDYKASFAILSDTKYVLINATLHFVDGETYEAYIKQQEEEEEPNPIKGDIDRDGAITVNDITRLIEIYLSQGAEE